MPLFVTDWTAATAHLGAAELVAYLRLAMRYWAAGRLASLFDSRDMDEYVRPASIWLDEAVAFRCVEPLHGSYSHSKSPQTKRTIETNLILQSI